MPTMQTKSAEAADSAFHDAVNKGCFVQMYLESSEELKQSTCHRGRRLLDAASGAFGSMVRFHTGDHTVGALVSAEVKLNPTLQRTTLRPLSANADTHLASNTCKRQKNMKPATTAKLQKKTSAKVKDPDSPAWTEGMLGAPVLKRGRGPHATPTKVLTSLRLDADILEFFKSKGAGYQSRINAALRTEVERNLADRPRAATRKRQGKTMESEPT